MDDYESLSHTKWEYKYHVGFRPKCRRKTLYGHLRQHLGEVFRRLAEQKESRIEKGHLMSDHVHMMIAIPPKYVVAQVVDSSEGRARSIWRGCTGSGNETPRGQHFWARGYFVSTVGRDEAQIRAYLRRQEQEDQRLYQLKLDC